MTRPSLTPQRIDAMLEAASRNVTRDGGDRIIWTATGIGRRISRSEDFVRKTLAKKPGTPIRYQGRRLYAFEAELLEYMRGECALPSIPLNTPE